MGVRRVLILATALAAQEVTQAAGDQPFSSLLYEVPLRGLRVAEHRFLPGQSMLTFQD